ncbi:hypothetical protein [uncultured Lacinutrix sp.]|uniref:hypothetical protein n=1 Tax=uncultured Lacinutrix sp. TaxID=574032 RepID=UPI0026360C74|nr:hypothetical protein [uncultured Lacinutrix sp.]
MKTLKITLVAVFSIGLLTAVSAIPTSKKQVTNDEIKQTKVSRSSIGEISKIQIPTQG